jgi:hypothetical protein
MGEKMNRRALLTGAFRKPPDPGEKPTARRRDSGAKPSREEREALDQVLEQMNGPTGFEDLEARKP